MDDNSISLLAEDEICRIEIHQSPSMLYILWKRHVEGEPLREKYQAICLLIKRFKPTCCLGNARAMYYTTIPDARWIFDKFVHSLMESSVTKYARIEAPRSLLLLDSLSLQEKINSLPKSLTQSFEFRFFTDEAQALNWLSSCA